MASTSRPWAAAVAACATLLVAIGAVAVVGAVADDDGNPAPASANAQPATDRDADGTMDHNDGTMDHNDGTGHERELDVMYADLPADVKAQVDITKALVEKYPTAADATKAGWQKATISLNGIGAHYLKGGISGFLGDYEFDPANPNVLLFDGEGPDAKIAGASFILTVPNPQGYPGELDVWHYHYGVCFDTQRLLVIAEVDGHEGSTISMTAEQCTAEGAQVFPIENLYMIHVWVAPDYIDDAPVFAHDHPKLYDGVTAAEQL